MALKHRVAAAQAQKSQLTDTEQPATISLKSPHSLLCLHCLPFMFTLPVHCLQFYTIHALYKPSKAPTMEVKRAAFMERIV